MSIFISSQDYLTMADECEQVSLSICNHNYKLWLKKDKVEQAQMIIEKIFPIIEKTANKNPAISFDKVLLISMIDILSKEKEYKIEPQKDLKQESSQEDLISNFIEILKYINKEIEEN